MTAWRTLEIKRSKRLLGVIVSAVIANVAIQYLVVHGALVLAEPLRAMFPSLRGDVLVELTVACASLLSVTVVLTVWGFGKPVPGIPFGSVLFLWLAFRTLATFVIGWGKGLLPGAPRYFGTLIRSRYGCSGWVFVLMLTLPLAGTVRLLLSAEVFGWGCRYSRVNSDVSNLARAIARMRTDTGSTNLDCLLRLGNLTAAKAMPSCGDLPNCTDATPGQLCWGGPYIPVITNDPWNNPYLVTLDPGARTIIVSSQGPDGHLDARWDEEHDDIHYVVGGL